MPNFLKKPYLTPNPGYVPPPVYVIYCVIYNSVCEIFPQPCRTCGGAITRDTMPVIDIWPPKGAAAGHGNETATTCPGHIQQTLPQLIAKSLKDAAI